MNEGLRIDRLTVYRQGRTLVCLDADIAPGEVLSVMGPSGVGKSSLVRAIGGFLSPGFATSGAVRLGGRDISALPPERRHIGVLFQDSLLFPHFSVSENILFALPPGGSRRDRCRRVAELLAPVGLKDLLDRDPATLSGGQQARVALMRVIAAAPRALLLDEPFSKLDADLRASVRSFVFDIVRERQLPTLLVTHDRADAEAAGGRVVELEAR
ncbi:MAG: ATP-binding cassette domain-containing protein [Alphaproteobacteria bacterium]|nr:ATP-binding cassette domain-containing protein [Alphaproteobacteria bacterium]